MINYKIFEFTKYTYNEKKCILKLYYKIDKIKFIEEINFNPNNIKLKKLDDNKKQALNISFSYLHLVAGISYYKSLLPDQIKIKTIKLNKEQKKFFDRYYLYGLGEFAFRNNLFLSKKINFPCSKNIKNNSINIKLNKNNIILPIGGGKDSLVSYEILKNQKNINIYPFSVNPLNPIEDCFKILNHNNIIIKRKISNKLLEINNNLEKYNGYNGHVPITFINTFIALSTSILYNSNTIIFSNEKSSNIGNIEHDGFFANHQWSKSFEAEKMINKFIKKYIIKSFNIFSLLRPIYEINIAKLFSKNSIYNNIFASCNKNFKITQTEKPLKWCCSCDKCRFVFLILSCFINKQEILNIFKKNIFNDKNQLDEYKKLVGLLDYKPFECVGEIEESITAFYLLNETEFKNDFIVKNINNELFKKYNLNFFEENKKKYFSTDFKNSLLTNKYKKLLINYINKC